MFILALNNLFLLRIGVGKLLVRLRTSYLLSEAPGSINKFFFSSGFSAVFKVFTYKTSAVFSLTCFWSANGQSSCILAPEGAREATLVLVLVLVLKLVFKEEEEDGRLVIILSLERLSPLSHMRPSPL